MAIDNGIEVEMISLPYKILDFQLFSYLEIIKSFSYVENLSNSNEC